MAQKVQVTLTCDVHADERPAAETIVFSLDNTAYEIDLCAEHADEFRGDVASFIAAGRRLGRKTAVAGARSRRSSSSAATSEASLPEIRAWARENGYEVSERGRVRADVLAAFAAAH
jgi:hypothetical protein